MKKNRHFLLILPFIALIGGPLTGITFGSGVNVYLTDLIAFAAFLYCIVKRKETVKIIRKEIPVVRAFLLFSAVLLLSLLFSPLNLSIFEKAVAGLYLCRFMLYFCVFIAGKILYFRKAVKPVDINKGLICTGLVLSLIGWVQYFLYPDLRNLQYLGWDPHYMRIFSTYFDPNYLGLVIVLSVISLSEISNSMKKWVCSALLIITLAFTYSRSSFLSLFLVMGTKLLVKGRWLVTVMLGIIFIVLLLLLPRPYGNESVKLERIFTLNERMMQWKEAGELTIQYPVLGLGFNTLRFARRDLALATTNFILGHSGAGVDNSFLFVGVTSGCLGLLSFSILLFFLYKKISYTAKLILTAILIHSFFLNSFFLPFVMLWFWLVAADSKEKKTG